jgi:hypothetical protein
MNRAWQIVAGGAVGGAIIGAFLAARDAEGFPALLCVLALWIAAGTCVAAILVVVDRVVEVVGRGLTLVFVRHPGPTASRGIVLLLFAAIGVVLLWPAIREVAGRPLPRRLVPPDVLRTALLVAAAAFAGMTVGYSARRRDRGPHLVLGLGLAGTAAALLIASSFIGPIHLPALRLTLVASSLVCAGLALTLTLPSTAWRRPATGLALAVLAGTFLWREGPIARFNPGHPYTATLQALWVGSGEAGPATARSRDLLRRWFGRQRSSFGDALDDAAPNRRSFNILWITICTLRKDRLGVFGNPRNLTPSMDALAAQSTVFERGYSTFPASACSMQSMFTSLYPGQTGFFRQKIGRAPFAGETWLPEVLRAKGWSTWAFTALDQMMLRGDFGVLMRGFDLTNPYPNVESPDGATIADAIEDALASHAERAPFFLWTLLMDAHSPFEGDPSRPELGTRVEDLYDGDVSVVERAVGRILRALSDAGRGDDTIVILHADHGEEFGDHGGRWHYSTVYDEQVAIPFMIRVPGVSPRRTPSPVDLTDLAPTVLEILDQPTLPLALGDSLVPLLLGGDLPSFAFAEVDVP